MLINYYILSVSAVIAACVLGELTARARGRERWLFIVSSGLALLFAIYFGYQTVLAL